MKKIKDSFKLQPQLQLNIKDLLLEEPKKLRLFTKNIQNMFQEMKN